jgi:hypothetical protein
MRFGYLSFTFSCRRALQDSPNIVFPWQLVVETPDLEAQIVSNSDVLCPLTFSAMLCRLSMQSKKKESKSA